MTLRQKLGTWLLGGPTEVDILRQALTSARRRAAEDLAAERAAADARFERLWEDQKAAERENREESRRLMEGTLDVMRELVGSVQTQQQTLTSYLNLFTAAPAPTLRTMNDEALSALEQEALKGKSTSRLAFGGHDPFGWLADPALFDPSSPQVLSEISQSIGDL